MSTPDSSVPDVPQLPLLEDAAHDVAAAEIKPTWRGWLHAATFPIAIVAGVVLIVVAQGGAAKWAAAVFMASSLLLFGNSALYHRIDWSPKVKMILKRIDHANILLLIAGTYTPLAVLALPRARARCSSSSSGRVRWSASCSAFSGSMPLGGCTSRSTCCSDGRR